MARVLVDMLTEISPRRASRNELGDQTQLDSSGLGLDSVELVELLLACEERFGVAVDGLLEHGDLTFGRVVNHFAAA